VDSSFEADWIYLLAARAIFPESYRGMVGYRPAWFIHVNPRTTYPRYIKTIILSGQTGTYFGPIQDKHAAQKLVHHIENLFDLCRDYTILTQSPHAGPCAWKQMGKCVGPCDGSVSLEAYRDLVQLSADVVADPQPYIEQQRERMQEAAHDLRFETAAKIKQHIEQLEQLRKGPFKHVRKLEEFRFLSLQRGPRAGTAKLFLITPGHIEEVAALIEDPQQVGDLLRYVLDLAEQRHATRVDDIGAEAVATVTHHLISTKDKGIFLRLDELEDRALAKAWRELGKQKGPEETDVEGVTKELQAL
jgi:excinuclease UvrABC nuclease subunit